MTCDRGVVLYCGYESVENWDDSFSSDNPNDPVADAVGVELNEGGWRDPQETLDGVLIDFDAQRGIVALEFLGASKLFPEAALKRLNNAA